MYQDFGQVYQNALEKQENFRAIARHDRLVQEIRSARPKREKAAGWLQGRPKLLVGWFGLVRQPR